MSLGLGNMRPSVPSLTIGILSGIITKKEVADRDIKELEETVRRMRKANEAASRIGTQPKKESNDLLQFFIGLIMLGAGLFWLFQKTTVSTSGIFALGGWMLGSVTIPSGAVILPFFCDRRIYGWIVTALGLAIIVLAIIMSIQIRFTRTTMFEFVMMFLLIGGGCGLLLKVLFRKR